MSVEEHKHLFEHRHGAMDPSVASHERGLWAVQWSFFILIATAVFQLLIYFLSGSVALLSDTIHNFGDAVTAIPLGIAFLFARLKPSKRFTFGYGRIEDLAGVTVVLIILFSAVAAGYEAIHRFFHPQPVRHLWMVAAGAGIGFLANEAVAIFRIRVGKEIGSAALVADGYHARADGFTSLAVLAGALGVWLGFPIADPLVGLGISVVILFIAWEAAREVFTRMLDGVEPEILKEIDHAARHAEGVQAVTGVRARWIGHKLQIEINITVSSVITVAQGHAIAEEVRRQLKEHLPHLGSALVHVDPDSIGRHL